MKIQLGEGLGPIKFGMKAEEVMAVLGEPDELTENADGEWPCWEMVFDEAEVVCSFALESGRLEMVMVAGGHELFGRDLHDLDYKTAMGFLSDHMNESPEVGAESVNDRAWTAVEYPDSGLSLTFEHDRLTLLIVVE